MTSHRAARWLVSLAVIALIHESASASSRIDISGIEPKSGIEISAQSPFNDVPSNGSVPVRVRIKNASASPGQWSFRFESPAQQHRNAPNRVTSVFAGRVEAGAEREFDFLVPLPTDEAGGNQRGGLELFVSGPATSGEVEKFHARSDAGRVSSGNIGVTEKFISGQGAKLTSALEGKKFESRWFAMDLALFPKDWRALSALTQVWMHQGEWDALPADKRLAFEQWVATGGVLFLASKGADPSENIVGFGIVRSFSLQPDGQPDVLRMLTHFASPIQRFDYGSRWPDAGWLPPYKANTELLVGLILLFGIIVGPVNFYFLAGREKRARIFWLTPLISLAGTIVIAATILLQDGLGGTGGRLALVMIEPLRNSEVVIQEQASKSGLLVSSEFRLDPAAMIQQIPQNRRLMTLSVNGDEYGGDWFQSRRVQGQLVTTVRPSRAEIRVLNPEEVAIGQPPRILSQVGIELTDLFLLKDNETAFHAQKVSPGREVIMAPCPPATVKVQLGHDFFRLAGKQIRTLAKYPDLPTAFFYGLSDSASDAMIPTLEAIRWSTNAALYICPVTP